MPNSPLVLSQPMIWLFWVVGVTLPFLPIYFSSIGLSDSKIALVLAVQPVTILLAGQVVSYLTDIHLNKKWMILILSLLGVGAMVLFPMTTAVPVIAAIMVLQAVSFGPRMSIINATVLSSQGGERRYGPLRTLGSLAFVVAGLVAGTLADNVGDLGLKWIFVLAAIGNVLCGFFALFLHDRPVGARHRPEHVQLSFMQVQRLVLGNPLVRSFLIFLFLSQIPHAISVMFQSRLITGSEFIGAPSLQAAIALNIGALAEIIVFLAFYKLVKRVRLMPLFLISVLSQSLRWAVIFFFPSLFVIQATNVLNMLSFGLMHICAVVFINREVHGELRASGQTVMAIVYMSLSTLFGQLIGFVFFNFGNVHQWYGLASVMVLISLPFWWRMKRLYEARHQVSGFWIPQNPPAALAPDSGTGAA